MWTRGALAATQYGVSDSGWMEAENFYGWVKCLFVLSMSRLLASGAVVLFVGGRGYLVPQEIWHPHTKFPRKYGTPLGNLVPPCKVRKCCILGAKYPSQFDTK